MPSSWLAIGVMSGTSADAADAALVRLSLEPRPAVAVLAFVSRPHPPELRRRILAACPVDAGSSRLVSELNVELGEVFAEAALAAMAQAGVAAGDVDVVGSHGQTVYHDGSAARATVRSTLQLGEPAVIAERTGCTVVSSFRARDVAAGGEGAPFVPYADWLLFADPARGRVLLNVGGIANVTVLPAGAAIDGVTGFDTGPGNMVIDALVSLGTNGRQAFDEDGRLAARGAVREDVLEHLLHHAYFEREPPKSTGREEFGEEFADALWSKRPDAIAFEDMVASATMLTVESVARALERWVLPRHAIHELYVSGGGARNPTMMAWLVDRLPAIAVRDFSVLGVQGRAKEAVAFAALAVQTLRGEPSNVPGVTGARHPVVLGSITPGHRFAEDLRRLARDRP